MAFVEDDGLVWKQTNGYKGGGGEYEASGGEYEASGGEYEASGVESHEDVWDDTALIEAYDRAVEKLKDEIKSEDNEEKSVSTKRKLKKQTKRKKPECTWRAGQKCLALFSVDGLYYEAEILSIDPDSGVAYVRFDHYENEEDVYIDDLLSVECKDELEPAIFDAHDEEEVEGEINSTKENTDDDVDVERKDTQKKVKNGNWKISDLCYVADGRNGSLVKAVLNSFQSSEVCKITYIDNGKQKKVKVCDLRRKGNEKKKTNQNTNVRKNSSQRDFSSKSPSMPTFAGPPSSPSFQQLPAPPPLPFAGWNNAMSSACYMPGTSLGYSTTPIAPPPPPPPLLAGELVRGDEEALANMLMSWYMTGYHTGYYRGIQQSRDSQKDDK